MKLLLDSCVWGGALRELENAGHDVIWSGNCWYQADWCVDLMALSG